MVAILGSTRRGHDARLSQRFPERRSQSLQRWGAFTALSGGSAPTMQISDAGGTVLVEAYVTKAGPGAVAVGPAGNGVAGTMGMGMQATSALLGKK